METILRNFMENEIQIWKQDFAQNVQMYDTWNDETDKEQFQEYVDHCISEDPAYYEDDSHINEKLREHEITLKEYKEFLLKMF